MHTIFTASAVLTAALTSAHNFTRGLTGLSPLLLTHSGITPSTIQQPSSGSSGQRFVVCFESDQLKMQTGSATANGAELEPAGLTRTRQRILSSPNGRAPTISNDEHCTSGLYAGVWRTIISKFCHGPVLTRFAGDANSKAARTSPFCSAVIWLVTTSTGESEGDGDTTSAVAQWSVIAHINVEVAKRAVRFDGITALVPAASLARVAAARLARSSTTKKRYVAPFYASLPPPTRIPR